MFGTYIWLIVWCFYRIPEFLSGISGSLCPYLFSVNFLGLCPFWLFCPLLMCQFLFYFTYFLLDACLFSNEGQEEGGSRREQSEELLEVEEGENRIRIYCIRKGRFSIKGKNTNVIEKILESTY